MLGTIGSIATVIVQNFTNIPAGISGNMIIIVDNARQYVSNYVDVDIGSNSIDPKYEPAIFSYSKADALDMVQASVGQSVSLGELTVTGEEMSSQAWRLLGDSQLNTLGRKARFARSLS